MKDTFNAAVINTLWQIVSSKQFDPDDPETKQIIMLLNSQDETRSGIFSLKHESSIFRSFIQPCIWFWKCQASSPEAKQYRV